MSPAQRHEPAPRHRALEPKTRGRHGARQQRDDEQHAAAALPAAAGEQ